MNQKKSFSGSISDKTIEYIKNKYGEHEADFYKQQHLLEKNRMILDKVGDEPQTDEVFEL